MLRTEFAERPLAVSDGDTLRGKAAFLSFHETVSEDSMRFDLVVWDFNGTIIDDVRLGIDSVNTLLAARGLPTITGVDEYRRRLRFPIIDYYRDLGFDFDAEPYEKLAHERVALYNAGADKLEATVGAREAIAAIADAGIEQMILSASERDMMIRALDRLGLTGFFGEILGQDNIYAAGKLETARAFAAGCGAKNPVVIGDTVHDAETARELGAQCILYTLGHSSPDDLRRTGATLVSDLRDAASLILE